MTAMISNWPLPAGSQRRVFFFTSCLEHFCASIQICFFFVSRWHVHTLQRHVRGFAAPCLINVCSLVLCWHSWFSTRSLFARQAHPSSSVPHEHIFKSLIESIIALPNFVSNGSFGFLAAFKSSALFGSSFVSAVVGQLSTAFQTSIVSPPSQSKSCAPVPAVCFVVGRASCLPCQASSGKQLRFLA